MITYPMRTYPNVVMKARAIERIELGRRVCDAMEPESLPLRVERDARLGATLAAFAAVCQRGDQARRRAGPRSRAGPCTGRGRDWPREMQETHGIRGSPGRGGGGI